MKKVRWRFILWSL